MTRKERQEERTHKEGQLRKDKKGKTRNERQ